MLVPLYSTVHQERKYSFPGANYSSFSGIDNLTLGPSLDDNKLALLAILVSFIYSTIAYIFLFSFSAEMSDFEFQSSSNFIDNFVARHAVIIRGINQKIGTKRAQKKVSQVFSKRFGPEKVISSHSYRPSSKVQTLYSKIKVYRKRLQEF